MIRPGLERIRLLLRHNRLPWTALHVAGTNGKGSICAAASAMLHAADRRCGRFTSPHLVDRWDCVTVGEEPVSESLFRDVERQVLRRNIADSVNASEFELLTATAFEIFTQRAVDIGVVEVGLGGRLDATNVLERLAVTVIAKVALDHQAFLGSTLQEIAHEKAGIIKPGVPCVVDGSNAPIVLETIETKAREVGAGPLTFCDPLVQSSESPCPLLPHEAMNLSCAFHAVSNLIPHPEASRALQSVLEARAAGKPLLQGRLQQLSLSGITSRKSPVLLDGAHNEDAARVLGMHVRTLAKGAPVTWVLALSAGKDVQALLKPLLRDGDSIVAVEFEPVDGMPWVQPVPAGNVVDSARTLIKVSKAINCAGDLNRAIDAAAEVAGEGPLVIAGSLYLVSSVLRMVRNAKINR